MKNGSDYVRELEGRLEETKDALDEAVAESERLRNILDKVITALATLDEALEESP